MNKLNLMTDKAILNDFLEKWPLERVRIMTLNEYVSTKDPETFCQYVETKTRQLGSIKGLNSIKFGIYKRGFVNKRPQRAFSDKTHSWLPHYGKTRKEAFRKIKEDLIKIIIAAKRLEFEEVDKIKLYNIFKWKVAFLYSNESFIPIYKKDALHKISSSLGFKVTRETNYSEIHRYIAETKPVGWSVFDYMRELFEKYKIGFDKPSKNRKEKRRTRKGTSKRNKSSQERSGSESYIANQFHNELQEALAKYLKKKHGDENVILEKNYVDVRVTLADSIHYYEVKTAGFAEYCIRQGIGQLFSYAHFENDPRRKEFIIFGKNPPTSSEQKFINYLKDSLFDVSFSYLSLKEIDTI